MSKNKVIKSVSFNLTNKSDVLILDSIKRKNFSGYVKKLILADISTKSKNKEDQATVVETEIEEKPLSSVERLRMMKESLKGKNQ